MKRNSERAMRRHFFRFVSDAVVAAILISAVLFSRGTQAEDTALIEQGKYLATAGDCFSCHTRPDGEPFSGGVAFKTPFGTIHSSNITPDPSQGIGGWTEEQFARAVREGVSANGDHLYPVLPYPEFTKISDADIHAIFAYVKSLQPSGYAPPKNDMKFPFGIRPLLSIWKALFFEPGRYTQVASETAEWNRGAYLVEGLGHCGACHTPRNGFGALKQELAFTGGTLLEEIKFVVDENGVAEQTGVYRPWGAVNLTPHPTGLAPWTVEDFVAYLKVGANRRANAFGPMSPVILNSTRNLTDEDLRAIAVYLKSLPAKTAVTEPKTDAASAQRGKYVFEVRCSVCHQSEGLGLPSGPSGKKVTAPLVGSAIIQAPSPASVLNVILYGTHPPIQSDLAWPQMPGYANDLSVTDQHVADLATYLRSAWGNKGDPVDVETVARQR